MVVVASAENGGLLHLVGDTLMIHSKTNKDGSNNQYQDQYLVPSSNALKGVELACFYFSASWCKPCQVFTPVLRQFYNEVCISNHVAIIFVSSDKDPQSFQQYYKQMPWFCIPPDQPTLRRGLALHFGIQGIPTLVVIDPSTGNVITTEGRIHVGQTVVTKGSNNDADKDDNNKNDDTDEHKKSSYSKKAQAVIYKWKSMEPIPVEEAVRNNASFNKPSNNNQTGLLQYLFKNPAFVFILIFIVRQSMSFVMKHASLYLNQQRQHSSSSSSTINVPLPPQQLSSSRPFVKILPNNNNNNNDKHEEDEF